MKAAVIAIAALAATVSAQNKPSYSGCASGQGLTDYKSGYRVSTAAFNANWNQGVKQNCAKLDFMVDVMSVAPYKPYCKQIGYQDALFDNYAKAQQKCFDDCKGNGKIMGETLGSQFCAISSYSATRGMPQPPTVAICNAVEQSQCESRYAYYVNQRCPGSKSSQSDYYNSLKKACKAI